VPGHDPEVVRAERPRRLDEREAEHLERGCSDHPRECRCVDDPDRDHRVAARRAEQADDQDREHEQWEGEGDVDDAHQHEIDEAAVEGGDEPDQEPGAEADADRDHPDVERDLRAVDDAGERVAAEIVGAERVRPARPLQARPGRVVRVGRPDEASQERRQHDEADHARADNPDGVTPARRNDEPAARQHAPDCGRGAHPVPILGSRMP